MTFLDQLTATPDDLAAEEARDPSLARCQGCGSMTEPEVCHCGNYETSHKFVEDHGFVPVGCDCLRSDDASRAARAAWKARGITCGAVGRAS